MLQHPRGVPREQGADPRPLGPHHALPRRDGHRRQGDGAHGHEHPAAHRRRHHVQDAHGGQDCARVLGRRDARARRVARCRRLLRAAQPRPARGDGRGRQRAVRGAARGPLRLARLAQVQDARGGARARARCQVGQGRDPADAAAGRHQGVRGLPSRGAAAVHRLEPVLPGLATSRKVPQPRLPQDLQRRDGGRGGEEAARRRRGAHRRHHQEQDAQGPRRRRHLAGQCGRRRHRGVRGGRLGRGARRAAHAPAAGGARGRPLPRALRLCRHQGVGRQGLRRRLRRVVRLWVRGGLLQAARRGRRLPGHHDGGGGGPPRRGLCRAAARQDAQGALGLRARRGALGRRHAQGQVPGHPAGARLPDAARPHREGLPVGAARCGEGDGHHDDRLVCHDARRIGLRRHLCQPVLHLLPGRQGLQGPDHRLRQPQGDEHGGGGAVDGPLPRL
mmetsp:Transcript_10300/g.32561  ORF Transcript_10300/g.32561 Transcript_10300/m.32561 type:complete len:447 (+) Transcript_10300:758-2098(+)